METELGAGAVDGFEGGRDAEWKPEGPRLCEECAHQLSHSNHENICRRCQDKKFSDRVNNHDPWKRSNVPKGGGRMVLRTVLDAAREGEGSSKGSGKKAVKPGEPIAALKDRRCICGEVPHVGPCYASKHLRARAEKQAKRSAKASSKAEREAVTDCNQLDVAADPTPANGVAVHTEHSAPTEFGAIAGKMVAAGFGARTGLSRVRMEDVPEACLTKHPGGTIGEIWDQLMECTPDEPVARWVGSSPKVVGQTAKHLRVKAAKLGVQLEHRRDGSVLYVWQVSVAAGSGSAIMARIGASQRKARTEQVG